MAFASGTFSLVSGNPVVTATTISSTWANNTLNDIADNGLTMCVLKDGTQTATAVVPFAQGVTLPTSALGNGYSATYTPTRAVDANVSGGTTRLAQYSRTGNFVKVAGQLQVDTTGAGATNFTLTLPVASNFANTFELGGSATAYVTSTTQYPVYINGNVSGNTADFYLNAAGAATYIISYTYEYLVI